MSHPEPTRICPMCHCLLWDDDFLQPGELETCEGQHPDGPAVDAIDDLIDRAVDALFDGRVVVNVHLVSEDD